MPPTTEKKKTEPPVEVLEVAKIALPRDATIYERLVAIVEELPAIGKDRVNEQQKFKFRGYDDVLNALNPLLARHGVFFVPVTLERLKGERPTRSGSIMHEVNLHVQFTFYGLGGDSVVASTWGEGTDSGDKATAKAHTMALKSALFEVFAISTEESSQQDPDKTTVEETVREGQQQRPAAAGPKMTTQPQLAKLFATLGDLEKRDGTFTREWLDTSIKASFGVDSPKDLTFEQAGNTIKHLEGELAKRPAPAEDSA